jgi:hypothetical protein
MVSMHGVLKTCVVLAGMAAFCLAPGGSARAQQVLDFSYTFSPGNVLSGTLTGTDSGDYFTVTGVQSLFYQTDITYRVSGNLFESEDEFLGLGAGYNGDGSAVVTIDGSYMDFFSNGGGGHLIFAYGDNVADMYGSEASLAVGLHIDGSFIAADWSATLVPEPGSLVVMASALGVLGVIARRRRAA